MKLDYKIMFEIIYHTKIKKNPINDMI